MNAPHATHVVEYLTDGGPGKAGQWQADCEVCGYVGQPQDYEADADAIARRHAEVGGFER